MSFAAKAPRQVTASLGHFWAAAAVTKVRLAPTSFPGGSFWKVRTGRCKANRWASMARSNSCLLEVDPVEVHLGRDASPNSHKASAAIRVGDWYLANACARWTDRTRLAPVRCVRFGDRIGTDRRVSTSHVHAARCRGCGPDWYHLTRESIRRFRQPKRPAGRDCLPGRARGGEVGPGAAYQPVHGQFVRRIVVLGLPTALF